MFETMEDAACFGAGLNAWLSVDQSRGSSGSWLHVSAGMMQSMT
jgi:hypothetical protein